jgi:hypothetical protein
MPYYGHVQLLNNSAMIREYVFAPHLGRDHRSHSMACIVAENDDIRS